MSGGIDSSLTAYLLKEAGYEAEGLSLILFEARGRRDSTACCSMRAIEDAARNASHIGMPHGSLDLRDVFMEKVMEPFVDAYLKGLTPNPCILCNRHIKFPYLLREARKRGAESIATGHYARVERAGNGVLLKKGADPVKDQSYVLYALRREELERLVLPLGTYTKRETRLLAREAGLPVTDRPESQEICFVEKNDYCRFIRTLHPEAEKPGPVVGPNGNTLGTHKGVYCHTIGQRKGLGISSPQPLYVTRIDLERNALHVGPREAAMRKELNVGELNWLLPRNGDFRATVKIRSMMRAQPALVRRAAENRVRIIFDEPQFAPTPGQSAVLYDGDTVVGGGVVEGGPDPF